VSRLALDLVFFLVLGLGLGACAELRGRKKIQEGNAAYGKGDFTTAAVRFTEATVFVPDMPLLWLNRGYACRELILPGADAAVNRAAGSCALESFKRLRELAPDDPRGDRLYVQTLLDLGEHQTIERTFNLRHERDPSNVDVVLLLQQVYSRTGRWRQALTFYRKGAALRPQDAEAQAAVGTYIWQILQKHGGGAALAEYDPRPSSARPSRSPAAPETLPAPSRSSALPPAPVADDIVGNERVALSDEGIRYLTRAIALRPRYPDALTYIGLLYRQQSFALFDDATSWERAVGQAVAFAARAAEQPKP
jgi:tetratricopeptide (TPR) repeat protein